MKPRFSSVFWTLFLMKKSVLSLFVLASASFAADPVPAAQWAFDGDKAARFEGSKGSFIRVTDPGEKSLFDFDNGDAITIEAWVNPASAPKGGNVYILGKGRTSNPGQDANNQNYGLRLWGSGSGGWPPSVGGRRKPPLLPSLPSNFSRTFLNSSPATSR